MSSNGHVQHLNKLEPFDVGGNQAAADQAQTCKVASAPNESEQRLRTLLDFAPEAIVMLDVESGRFIHANPMAEQLFGLPRERLLEAGPFEFSPAFQPGGTSAELGQEKIAEAFNGGAPIFEWWHCNARGERFPCEVRLVRMPYGKHDVIRGTIVDMSKRKLLELSERGRRRILENVAHGASLCETLSGLVITVESLLPGMICSILLLDRETKSLRLGAAPSLPDFYNAAVDGLRIGPTVGSCGTAAATGQRFIVSDLTKHPNWDGFRELTERARVKACWSEPIKSLVGSVLGTFAMYYREPSEPAPVELKAIEVAAEMAAIVIEHDRARQSLQEINQALERRADQEAEHLAQAKDQLMAASQESRLAAVAFETHDSIVITDKYGKILRVNKSFTKLTGYAPEDVIGKTPRVLRSGRHDDEFYREMWRAIGMEGYWEGEVWNKRKDGLVYLQRLTIACVKNAFGETTHYVGDGQDITWSKQAEADRVAINAAREVQLALFPSQAPRMPGFDIAGAVRPAERVSGDFFDYISLGQNSVGILVADVCGHGLGPALMMAQTQAYLRALAESCADPGELLTRANRLFATSGCGRFITMFLGRLDADERTFVHAGAAHQGFLVRANGEAKVLDSTGLPLGVLDNTNVTLAPAIDLKAGDIVLLPTDGIEETSNPDRCLFGRERMLDVVRNHAAKSAAQIVEALFCEAREFAEGKLQEDDITAVVVKVLATS